MSASNLKLFKNFLVKYWRLKYPLVNLKLLGNVLYVMLRDCDLVLVFSGCLFRLCCSSSFFSIGGVLLDDGRRY